MHVRFNKALSIGLAALGLSVGLASTTTAEARMFMGGGHSAGGLQNQGPVANVPAAPPSGGFGSLKNQGSVVQVPRAGPPSGGFGTLKNSGSVVKVPPGSQSASNAGGGAATPGTPSGQMGSGHHRRYHRYGFGDVGDLAADSCVDWRDVYDKSGNYLGRSQVNVCN